jgi:hypothetical protein
MQSGVQATPPDFAADTRIIPTRFGCPSEPLIRREFAKFLKCLAFSFQQERKIPLVPFGTRSQC